MEQQKKSQTQISQNNDFDQKGSPGNLSNHQSVQKGPQQNYDPSRIPDHNQEKNQLFESKQVDLSTQPNGAQNLDGEPYRPQVSKSTWSENQLYQLNHQIKAYKHLLQSKPVPDEIMQRISLQNPHDWAYRRELIHQQTQQLYEERFEQNHQLNFHDVWEYINKKLQSEGENALKVNSDNLQLQAHISRLNEVDEIQHLEKELETLIADETQPLEQRRKAEMYLKMLQVRPLQQKMREDVLNRYLQNKIALSNYKAQTQGDYLYERQLVDREFYKRAKIYSSSKKEARTLDRFEQQMRSGQELRKKTRHKEFLNEILYHAKEFQEFHKKKSNQIKKKALIIKSNIDSKEKKEQLARDKEERERIKALKENNFETYLDLVSSQKNSRLFTILEQTHKYLEQLGAKVHKQKEENKLMVKQKKAQETEEGDDEDKANQDEQIGTNQQNRDDDDEINDSDKIKSNLRNSSKVYYSITHTVQEEIPEQPKMIKGGTLKPYQMKGLNWMISLYNNNLNGILADEMGLGKTIQTISLFCYLIETKGNEGPFLVVVPLTTISNWSMEFDKWAPDIRKIIYKGKKHERPLLAQHLKNDKYHVVLTTYEYILNDKATLSKIQWQYIIVDEGHRMKNQKSKFALTLGQQYQSAHRLLLTGTPLQNNLSELWALLNFLLPKIFSSCDEFQKWFDKPLSKIHPVTNSKLTNDEKQAFELSEEEQLLVINRLHQVLRPFLLRRIKAEVEKELPSKIEMVIKVDLSAWQKIVYNGIQDNGTLARDPSTGKLGTLALRNTVMQLRKICNHPYLFMDYLEPEDYKDNIYRASGKFELLDRILPKMIRTGHKVLIFSQFTQLMDIMQIFFDYRGIKHLRLDGGTKHEDRARNLQIFNDPDNEFQVFLLSTRAGGHGLNLQVADTVIIFDSDWNPQMDEQAKDRAHRIGQKREVRVYRLITTTKIEEGILYKATQKKDLDAKIIQAGMFNEKASDMERQKRLEDLIRKDYEEDDDQEQATEIPDDEQINEIIARDQNELEIFTQMDQQRYIEERKDERMKDITHRYAKKGLSASQVNYRLLQDWEVPEWIKIQPEDPNKVVQEFGMGKRQRKQVNYNDEISEGQWLRIIESGGDVNQEIEKRKKKKIQREQGLDNEDSEIADDSRSKRRKTDGGDSQIDDDEDVDEYGQDGNEQSYISENKNKAQQDPKEKTIKIQISKNDIGKDNSESRSRKRNQKALSKNLKDTSNDIQEDEEDLVMSGPEEENPDQQQQNEQDLIQQDASGRSKRRAAPTDLKEK